MKPFASLHVPRNGTIAFSPFFQMPSFDRGSAATTPPSSAPRVPHQWVTSPRAKQRIWAQLPLVATALAILYAVFAVGHYFLLSPEIAGQMVWLAGLSSLGSGLVAARARRIPIEWAHPVAAGLAAVMMLNSLVHLHLTRDPHETLNLVLALVAAGVVVESRPWMLSIVVTGALGFTVVAIASSGTESWTSSAFAVLSSTILAFVAHEVRIRAREQNDSAHEELDRIRKNLEGIVEDEAHKLVESQRLFDVVSSASGAGVAQFDARGRLVSCNVHLCEITGVVESRLRGFSWPRAIHPEDRPAFWRQIRRARPRSSFETRIVRPGGEVRFVSGQVDMDRKGGRLATCVVLDVTEQRLRRDRADEENRLASLGRLSSGIAHDFNNVLGAIVATSEHIRLQYPAAAKDTETILQAAQRATRVISGILDFGRTKKVTGAPVNLGGLVDETVTLLQAAKPGNVTLEVSKAGEVWVLADVAQLQRVLMNLCTNAIQAMPNGGTLSLGVKTAAATTGSGPTRVAVEVSDTGVGMDADTARKVFQPYFSKRKGGTGLGLSVVHGIVTSFDGEVAIQSELGRGTTVEVRLVQTAPRAPSAPIKLRQPTLGLRVVLVDDDDVLRHVVKRMLETCGYSVTAFSNGPDALGFLKEAPPDVVLTDLAMPGMDGLTLVREVRKQWASLPIVMSSGFGAERLEDVHHAGADALVPKPATSEQLQDAIEKAVAHRQAQATVVA